MPILNSMVFAVIYEYNINRVFINKTYLMNPTKKHFNFYTVVPLLNWMHSGLDYKDSGELPAWLWWNNYIRRMKQCHQTF